MKTMKKLMAIVLAIGMMLALNSAAFAASIDVQAVLDGETYTAYKILNYKDGGGTGENRKVSYYLTAAEYEQIGSVLEAAGFGFTASSDGTQYYVNNAKTLDAAAAAEYLATNVTSLGNALGKKTATGADGSATFTDLATGYYFVTSTAGSLCALHEDKDIATVVEKNTVTVPDKQQGTTAGTYSDAQLDLNIGDTVYYNSKITIGKGANYEITGTDTLSTGLTLNHEDGDITVKVDGAAVATTNYTLNASDSGFTIVFTAAYVSTLTEGKVINIEYSAVINENAVIRGDNPNTWKIDYSQQHKDDKTVVKTYDILVKKTDGTTFVPGAGFKLYTDATGGSQIIVSKDNTGYYVDPDGNANTEIMVDTADGVNVRGLAPGTYYLEETTVPDGYNKLAARKAVTVVKDGTAAVEVEVINEKGTELPSTGGMGTTILYIMGGALVVVCGIMLVAKKRTSNK